VLDEGLRTKVFAFKETAKQRAWLILGALEGAMLVARSYGEPRRFTAAAASVLADLRADKRSKPRRTPVRSASR